MRAGPLSKKTVSDTLNRYFVPVYTSNEDYEGSGADPPEEWIVLGPADIAKLLPPQKQAPVGSTWEIDRDVATKIFTHFYPQTENNDVAKNKIERISLRATAVSSQAGVVRARLDGD